MFTFLRMDSQPECDNTTVDLYTDKELKNRYDFENIDSEKRLIELGNYRY
jgi:hypothetical protein